MHALTSTAALASGQAVFTAEMRRALNGRSREAMFEAVHIVLKARAMLFLPAAKWAYGEAAN